MDDEPMVLEMLTQLLNMIGYDVDTASEGLEAIDMYVKAGESGRSYQMVILDLTVARGLGGKLTMERLLAFDPHAKGIILSGYSEDPVIQDYRQYGFIGSLKKPFSLKALEDIFEKHSQATRGK